MILIRRCKHYVRHNNPKWNKVMNEWKWMDPSLRPRKDQLTPACMNSHNLMQIWAKTTIYGAINSLWSTAYYWFLFTVLYKAFYLSQVLLILGSKRTRFNICICGWKWWICNWLVFLKWACEQYIHYCHNRRQQRWFGATLRWTLSRNHGSDIQ